MSASYELKLEKVSAIISEHNSQVQAEADKLNWEKILTQIKSVGGTTADSLREMTWEDLQHCGIPRVLARRIANTVLRKDDNQNARVRITPARAQTMTALELLENYDPTGETNTVVAERLKVLGGNHKFIIFNDNVTVNAKESNALLSDINRGFSDVESVRIDRKLYRTYAVGERPNEYFDENPIFPGRMLRSNGTCDVTDRSWADVRMEIKQILYLAVSRTKELKVSLIDDAHRVMDSVINGPDPMEIVQRYKKAVLLFEELKETNAVPTLRIRRGPNNGRTNDPFYGPLGKIAN